MYILKMLITNKEMEVNTKQTPVLESNQVQAEVSLPYHAEMVHSLTYTVVC